MIWLVGGAALAATQLLAAWLAVAFGASSEATMRSHNAAEAAMFEFLTRNRWVAGGTTVVLRRGGDYRWSVMSDYLEHDESGKWNFALTTDSTGCIWLGAGGVVRFERAGTSLRLRTALLSPGDTISYDASGRARSRADLPPVADPPLYAELVSKTWKPAGYLAFRSPPARLRYTRDGRRIVEDSTGRCLSVSGFDLTGSDLTEERGWGTCERAGNRSDSLGNRITRKIRFEDGMLFEQGGPDQVYRPIDDPDSTQIVADDVRGLRVRALFPSRIEPGRVFSMSIALLNEDRLVRRLARIGVGRKRWKGDSLILVPNAVRDYPNVEIRPGEWFRDTLSVTFDAEDMISLPAVHTRSWDAAYSYDEWINLLGLTKR